MSLLMAVLLVWIISMVLVTYVFCGAARRFLSSPEREASTLEQSKTA